VCVGHCLCTATQLGLALVFFLLLTWTLRGHYGGRMVHCASPDDCAAWRIVGGFALPVPRPLRSDVYAPVVYGLCMVAPKHRRVLMCTGSRVTHLCVHLVLGVVLLPFPHNVRARNAPMKMNAPPPSRHPRVK